MIRTARDGGLLRIVIDRPEKANALTEDMLRDIHRHVTAATGDADLRAVVLTGAGEKVFSAGADLDAARAGLATSPVWEEVSGAIVALPVLSIAALNGSLAGGAFGMALACDLRIAVPGARFFYPVAKLGFLPQPSDPGRLRALVGPARTKLLLLGGARWTAEEALTFGLVDRIVPGEAMMDTVRTLAADALAGDPDTLRAIKAMCRG